MKALGGRLQPWHASQKTGRCPTRSESCRELIFRRNVMNAGGSDELMTLTNSIDTHFGTKSPTDRLLGPGHMLLPTRRAVWEDAIFPLFDLNTPPASGGSDPGACARVHAIR